MFKVVRNAAAPRQPFHKSWFSSPGYQKLPDIKPAFSGPPPFPSLPSKGPRATDSSHLPLAALHASEDPSLTASGKISLCVRGLHTPATSQRMRYDTIKDNGSAGNVLSHSSPIRLFATPWTVAPQAPLSVEFSRQEYWSGLLCPPLGIFPTQGSNPGLLHLRWILYHLSHLGSPLSSGVLIKFLSTPHRDSDTEGRDRVSFAHRSAPLPTPSTRPAHSRCSVCIC